jgi:hypothetical protein
VIQDQVNQPKDRNDRRNTVAQTVGSVTRTSPTTTKGSAPINPKKALMKKLPGGFAEGELKSVADKAFATEAIIMVAPAAGLAWITLQLPLAIVGLVFMGISAALDAAEEAINSNVITGTLYKIGSAIVSTINEASKALFDFDFTSLKPSSLFMMVNGLVMLIGWFTILTIGFVFLIMGLSPVFGKGSVAKITALILSLVFYALPIFNLFPWFGLWVLAVWLYPTDD